MKILSEVDRNEVSIEKIDRIQSKLMQAHSVSLLVLTDGSEEDSFKSNHDTILNSIWVVNELISNIIDELK